MAPQKVLNADHVTVHFVFKASRGFRPNRAFRRFRGARGGGGYCSASSILITMVEKSSYKSSTFALLHMGAYLS